MENVLKPLRPQTPGPKRARRSFGLVLCLQTGQPRQSDPSIGSICKDYEGRKEDYREELRKEGHLMTRWPHPWRLLSVYGVPGTELRALQASPLCIWTIITTHCRYYCYAHVTDEETKVPLK